MLSIIVFNSLIYFSELIANDEVTDICKILYESPGFTLSIEEVKDKLNWDNAKFQHAVQMAVDSSKISVRSFFIAECLSYFNHKSF